MRNRKVLDLVGRGDGEELRGIVGRGNLNQDIVYEKNSILNKRKRILQYEGISLEVK